MTGRCGGGLVSAHERRRHRAATKQLALFADLRWPALDAVAHSFDEAVFAAGQRVLRQGLTGGAFYVILEGEAAAMIDGREVARLGRGDHFGEISTLLGERRWRTSARRRSCAAS